MSQALYVFKQYSVCIKRNKSVKKSLSLPEQGEGSEGPARLEIIPIQLCTWPIHHELDAANATF